MERIKQKITARNLNAEGYTLIEVIIVMIIVAVLATGVVFMFANPTAKVKAAAFEMRGDFNLARAEAVRRNDEILVHFVDSAKETCSKTDKSSFDDCFAGGSMHGYVICFDADSGNDCDDEVRSSPPATAAEVAEDLADKIIKTVLFSNSVKYYEFGATLPTLPSGPAKDPGGTALASNNGITFASDFVSLSPDGTSTDTGAVVLYLPLEGSDLTVRGKPYAIVLDSVSTGRVMLYRWRPDIADDAGTPFDERWSKK